MTPLRRRMIEDMKLKNLSARTIGAYASRVGAFARHFGRSPQDLGRDEVRAYLLHLVQEKKVSWSVYNRVGVSIVGGKFRTTGSSDGWSQISSSSVHGGFPCPGFP